MIDQFSVLHHLRYFQSKQLLLHWEIISRLNQIVKDEKKASLLHINPKPFMIDQDIEFPDLMKPVCSEATLQLISKEVNDLVCITEKELCTTGCFQTS